MREEDPQVVREIYVERRAKRALYGTLMSLAGLAVLFAPVGWPEWLRHATAWALVLYGGMMVDPKAVGEWHSLFGGMLPWTKGKDDG